MIIKHVDIIGIGGIRELHLDFNDRMNILCGPNSIGKTTVIESVATMFCYGQPSVKRNVALESGQIHATVVNGEQQEESTISVKTFNPRESETTNSFTNYANKLLSIKVGRNFGYSRLNAVPSDPDRAIHDIWNESRSGVGFSDVKGWFVNRFLYSTHPGSLSSQQLSNYNLAVKCFSIINPNYYFSNVKASANDIMINTPQGEIYFEFLSSGYKSILYLLFSIIKEIEFRFKEHQLKAEDFDGIILIDEVEVHLHPEWQERIVNVLCDTFKNAQFIVTTHSPHVIQAAEPNEIIALHLDGNNNVSVRDDIETGEYGFKGWTVEEILYDVMGMKTLRTELYLNYQREFGKAVDDDNYDKAMAIYEKLDKLLHPSSPQRKLLQFQLAGIAKA